MSDVIRLDAIPIRGLPQMVQSEPVESASTKMNCVLHCQRLPAHHHLEVSVNRVVQQPVPEGEHLVFAWQLEKASDEASITLFHRGMMAKQWRGCWNERDAIVSLGNLPVRVFFDGKPQPQMEAVGTLSSAAPLAAMHPTLEGVNGSGHTAILEQTAQGTPESRRPDEQQEAEEIIVQDLLVIAERSPGSTDHRRTEEEESDEEGEPEERIEEEDEEREDETLEDEEIEDEAREDELEEDREIEEENVEVEEDGGNEDEDIVATSPRVAAFHASPLSYEKTLEALTALLVRMPTKTIIVDLRRHSRAKKSQGQSELTKERLRAVFGAKYWDRGWAIPTTYQRDMSSQERYARWRQVLGNAAREADGIPFLVKQLQEGYSLVVMDSIASYAESSRRAVIEELQQQVPPLVVGPVG